MELLVIETACSKANDPVYESERGGLGVLEIMRGTGLFESTGIGISFVIAKYFHILGIIVVEIGEAVADPTSRSIRKNSHYASNDLELIYCEFSLTIASHGLKSLVSSETRRIGHNGGSHC